MVRGKGLALKKFKDQLEGFSSESGIALLAAACLMVLFIYQGSPGFFLERFAHRLPAAWDPEALGEAYRFFFSFVFLFIVPVLMVRFVFRRPLRDYGVAVGDAKFGLAFTALSFIVLPLPLYLNAGTADFLEEYPLWREAGASAGNYALWVFLYLFYYVGWEFFFRGFMQFSLAGRVAPFLIIMIQTIPSTVLHIGKPGAETASAVVAGIVFGAVALRTRSVLYPLLVHWYVGALTELFAWMHSV
jgi:membrane protease YdiL (CAAX protease family)